MEPPDSEMELRAQLPPWPDNEMEPPDSDMVPSSVKQVSSILRVAHEYHLRDRFVSYICCYACLEVVKRVDPLALEMGLDRLGCSSIAGSITKITKVKSAMAKESFLARLKRIYILISQVRYSPFSIMATKLLQV